MRSKFLLAFLAAALGLSLPATSQVVRPEPHRSLPEFLGYVPDELIVVIAPHARHGLTVQTDPRGRVVVDNAALQAIVDANGVVGFARQFQGARPRPVGSAYPDLTGHYKLRLAPGTDLDAVAAAFEADPDVDHVEKIGMHTLYNEPDDPYFRDSPNGSFPYDQWHYWDANGIDAELAWDSQTGDPGVLVGILDSGTRYFHADLGGNVPVWGPDNPSDTGNIFINPGEVPGNGTDDDGNGFVDDTIGWDFVSSAGGFGVNCIDQDCSGVDNDPDDGDGHGTHVAGTVGAITNNGILVSGVAGGFADSGGANGARVIPLRIGYHATVFGQVTGVVRMDWAAEAMNYVAGLVDAGHNVAAVNCSWGSSDSGGLSAAVDDLLAHDVMVVHAAGNSDSSSADFLGTKAGVMNVAATDQGGNGASFTNYGSWVDVAAPGVDILSTYRNPDDSDDTAHYIALLSGTSMSAPHVCGIAALLESCVPSLSGPDKFNLITGNTNPYSDSRDLGSGIANAKLALDAAGCTGTPCDLVADFSGSPTSGCAPLAVQFSDLSSGSGINAWAWDFGDGNTSTAQNPSHSYASTGTYTVSLTTSSDTCSDSVTKSGYVSVSDVPIADFSGSPTSGTAPLTVDFSDLSGGGPTSWAWDFGDSSTSTAQNPSHTYQSAGTYTVSLTVSNVCGSDLESKVGYITVEEPCDVVADFSGTPTSGCASLSVQFTDLSTGTNVNGWAWDFGDGNTSTAQNPSHSYAAAGTYTVSLTSSNDTCSDSVTKNGYISVSDVPSADFSGSPTSGTAPLSVDFSDLSGGEPTSWSWDFGDSSTSTAQNPSHTYQSAGTYTVSLTVSNACGSDLESKVGYITVDEPSSSSEMSVADIVVTRQNLPRGDKQGQATVTILDNNGQPVSGATVVGDFTGKTTDLNVTGVTDSSGQAVLLSGIDKGGSGEWCFEVTNVSHSSLTYDSSANTVTQSCEGGDVF